MESLFSLVLPLMAAAFALKLLSLPLRLTWKAGIHAGFGFLYLGILNCVSGITGLYLPVNAVTVLLAGALGVPGIGLIAALEAFF